MTEEDMGFFKQQEEEEAPKTFEMTEDETQDMDIKQPKPFFKEPTKCDVVDAVFFKHENKETDKNGSTYTPFQITITFRTEDSGIEFKETYRGGRVYVNEEGKTSIYIGPKSALGKVKNEMLRSKIDIGRNIKSFGDALKDKKVQMIGETISFQGDKYEKNFIHAFLI
jgi:hypothetical protein